MPFDASKEWKPILSIMIVATKPAFYKLEDFPQLKCLAEHWTVIRDEYLELPDLVMDIDRVDKTHEEVMREIKNYLERGHPYGWVQGWGDNGANPDWVQFPLIVFDHVFPFVLPRMEKTLELLSPIRGIKICGLSKMLPHTFLSTHQHPEIAEEGLLQLHIPLETAKDNYAYFNVNGEFRHHRCGEPLIFDGSNDHFAVNASEGNRTILYMEFNKRLLMRSH